MQNVEMMSLNLSEKRKTLGVALIAVLVLSTSSYVWAACAQGTPPVINPGGCRTVNFVVGGKKLACVDDTGTNGNQCTYDNLTGFGGCDKKTLYAFSRNPRFATPECTIGDTSSNPCIASNGVPYTGGVTTGTCGG